MKLKQLNDKPSLKAWIIDILRILFPPGQGHVRIALAILTVGGGLIVGPPLLLAMAAGGCAYLGESATGFCGILRDFSMPQYGLGVALILLAVAVYFAGAKWIKQPPPPLLDDFFSTNGDGLTLKSAVFLLRQAKQVPISFRNIDADLMGKPLQKVQISGNDPSEALASILASIDGGTPAGLTHWSEGGHFFVGRKDS
jgi:hypothetical protein